MKYADINRRYTEIVAEYMAKGYTINTRTMSGSQGEYAHIDLTDGVEIIRVLVDTFYDHTDISLEGLEIIVGRASSEVEPNRGDDRFTVWNSKLDIMLRERFYEIGADRRHGKFYGTEDEATTARKLSVHRYASSNRGRKTERITSPKAIEIAKRVIRRKFGVKRISEGDITVSKYNGIYTIGYRNKAYRLH